MRVSAGGGRGVSLAVIDVDGRGCGGRQWLSFVLD